MSLIANIFVALVALEHLYILYIEMFAWTTKGNGIAPGLPADFFVKTKSMAANQGLYNGFLAAGLIWSLFIPVPEWSHYTAYFFLTCVIVAGIYGGITVNKSIFLKQALPAILALCLILL